ncbi:hypothetical protein GC174_05740 [bacterium]|nr:hypothetical protein [bacterium]
MTTAYTHLSTDLFLLLDSFLQQASVLAALDKSARHEIYESCLGELLCLLYSDRGSNPVSGPSCPQVVESGSFCIVFPEDFDPGSIHLTPVRDPKQRLLRPIALVAPGASRESYFALYVNEDLDKLSEKDQYRIALRVWSAPDSFKPFDVRAKLLSDPALLIDIHKFETLLRRAGGSSASAELQELRELFSRYNNSITFSRYSLQEEYASLELARVKAAFFANGISYSDARRADDHYSHLVEQSDSWFVLFQLRESSLLKVTDNRDILFTIRYDDFRNGDFEKGRVVLS